MRTDDAASGEAGPARADVERQCRTTLAASVATSAASADPFPHWVLEGTLPALVLARLKRLPLTPPPRDSADAARTAYVGRHYFTPEFLAAFPSCRAIAEAFQNPATVALLAETTGVDLDGCFLRIELALDVDGFHLAPHTDLGVKRFTLLTYVAAGGQRNLGTDLYRDARTWARQVPFTSGTSLMFLPSAMTWHGFERRPIRGVRRTLIVNYVTAAWRDREQLAFPARPVTRGAA